MKQWKEPTIINLGLKETKVKKDKTDCCGHNINHDDPWHPGNHYGWCCEYNLHIGKVTSCS